MLIDAQTIIIWSSCMVVRKIDRWLVILLQMPRLETHSTIWSSFCFGIFNLRHIESHDIGLPSGYRFQQPHLGFAHQMPVPAGKVSDSWRMQDGPISKTQSGCLMLNHLWIKSSFDGPLKKAFASVPDSMCSGDRQLLIAAPAIMTIKSCWTCRHKCFVKKECFIIKQDNKLATGRMAQKVNPSHAPSDERKCSW